MRRLKYGERVIVFPNEEYPHARRGQVENSTLAEEYVAWSYYYLVHFDEESGGGAGWFRDTRVTLDGQERMPV